MMLKRRVKRLEEKNRGDVVLLVANAVETDSKLTTRIQDCRRDKRIVNISQIILVDTGIYR